MAAIGAGRRIEYASLAWTAFEALAGIVAGVMAGSIALIGFGADSIIEMASSAILLWRLNHELGEQRERTALRLVGISFLLLAIYVGWEAVESLAKHHPPSTSYFGIVGHRRVRVTGRAPSRIGDDGLAAAGAKKTM